MHPFAAWHRFTLFAVVLVVCLLLPGCKKSKVTSENYNKITNGMSMDDVLTILGPGEKDESGDGSGGAAQFGVAIGGPERTGKSIETYNWTSGEKIIHVYIQHGKVINKRKEGF